MKSILILACVLGSSLSLIAQQWTTSGTNIYNANTGNVGIGVTAPLEKLHINGSIRGNSSAGSLRINTTAGYVDIGPINTAFAHFYTNMAKYYFDKPVYADGGFSSYATNDFLLQTNGTVRMSIKNANGYVGIGTTNPDGKLDVRGCAYIGNQNEDPLHRIALGGSGSDYGSIGYGYYYTNTTASHTYAYTNYASQLRFDNGGFTFFTAPQGTLVGDPVSFTNAMSIKNSGNVSIGGANSSAKFSVYQNVTGDYLNAVQINSLNPNIHWPLVISTNSKANHSGFVSSSASDMYLLIRDRNGNVNVQLNSNGNSYFTGGNIGVGTNAPEGKLHVKGCAYFGNQNEDAAHRIALGGSGGDYGSIGYGYLYTNSSLSYKYSVIDYASQLRFDQGGFTFNTAASGSSIGSPVTFTSAMVIKNNGNVGIGSNPDHKLDVKGTVHAEEVLVDLNVPGPDYVFEPDYNLLSLKETEGYININKHLPEVPSAKEMEADGIKLKEMNLLLLKKVEELTLHLIQMEKTVQEQNERIQTLENTQK
jgi:hypothetical protein